MRKGTFYQKGVTILEQEVQFVFQIEKMTENVEIGIFAGKKELQRIAVPKTYRQGALYSVRLMLPKEADGYCYYADNEPVPDLYAKGVQGLKDYGREKKEVHYLLPRQAFDWAGDCAPAYAYSDSVVYGIHVRGFTRHTSSGVRKKGTFAGIKEKLSYLTELGITAIELMPAYEFDEVELLDEKYQDEARDCRINYWGFKRGYYYAPKSAYAYTKDAPAEMKDMIKAAHRAGIEVWMQFYFPKTMNHSEIPEILRFWVTEYHIDGFHLLGAKLPAGMIGADPLLKQTKLVSDYFPMDEIYPQHQQYQRPETEHKKNLAFWKNDFTYDMRKALKGDEGCMSPLAFHLQDNQEHAGVINTIAGYDGFTLQDIVSYDRKHNEANGEDNQDGNDYNCSWNCGVEGKTRKRTIQLLRRKQMRNALALVFLSQGTPYLQSGDEFGQTQNGNNNPYCQDNETTWLDWRLLKNNRDFYEYVRSLIAFRKAHAVFHRELQLKGLDYLGCGCPDISLHGEDAWKPLLEHYSRQLGVMYSGRYAVDRNGCADADFYVALNMHWESHEFALPKLPKDKCWKICLDTSITSGFLTDEAEAVKEIPKNAIVAEERSIILCQSVKKDDDKAVGKDK